MMSSNPHAAAIAALTALGSDLVAMRGRASKLSTDNTNNDMANGNSESAFRRRSLSKGRSRRRASTSSRSTTRTRSSSSSTKSLSKVSRSKGKSKPKAKSTTSKASNTKANTMGSDSKRNRRTTVLTVAPHPKPEKYVPPPRGTFRSSRTRYLRSEVIGALVSEIEDLGIPVSVPLIAADYSELLKELKLLQQEYQNGTSPSTIAATKAASPTLLSGISRLPPEQQQLTERPVRPPPVPLTGPILKLTLEDLPVLGLAEFDFFSASRSRSSDIRETSPVWSRSPAAPAPPRVRRWLKEARKQPVGTLEEVYERPKSGMSGEGKGEEG